MPESLVLPGDFADRLRAARNYVKLNQDDFAKEIGGVSGSTIGNWETRRTAPGDMATTELVKRLAKASKLPEWFFTVPRLANARLPAQAVSEQPAVVEKKLSEIEKRLGIFQLETAARDGEVLKQLAALRKPSRRPQRRPPP